MPDLSKLVFHSGHNAFKNVNVHREELTLPTAIASNAVYTNTITFNLDVEAKFIMPYIYATSYSDYFIYLDSQLHDDWRKLHLANTTDYLIIAQDSFGDMLQDYTVRMRLSGNNVQFILRMSRLGTDAITIPNHPTYKVPITLIEYTLAN